MKTLIYSLYFIGIAFAVKSKKNLEVNLIKADSTWGKEIIEVPFWFAPEIKYKGYEDIRFAQGWENIDSNGF